MWGTIERLRKKPRAFKERFSLVVAGLVTSVFAVVWIVTLSFGSSDNVGQLEAADAQGAQVFSSFFKGAKKELSSLRDALSDIDTATTTVTTTEPVAPAEPTELPDADGLVLTVATSTVNATTTIATTSPERVSRVVLIATTSSASSSLETE